MLFRHTPLVLLGLVALGGMLAPAHAANVSAVGAPVLKWQYGGCSAPPHYCDTGWYASPAVADLDGDGKPEVIWANSALFALNSENGSVQWQATNGSRAWPGIAVADLNGNGSLRIIVWRNSDP